MEYKNEVRTDKEQRRFFETYAVTVPGVALFSYDDCQSNWKKHSILGVGILFALGAISLVGGLLFRRTTDGSISPRSQADPD